MIYLVLGDTNTHVVSGINSRHFGWCGVGRSGEGKVDRTSNICALMTDARVSASSLRSLHGAATDSGRLLHQALPSRPWTQ